MNEQPAGPPPDSTASPQAARANWLQPCAVRVDELPWLASPAPQVHRRLLERHGGEVALATSVVRYAPGSRFEGHRHPRGEEILVLDGVFSDEHGHYPAGTYLKNPPGSAHSPYSEPGCTLFVKLRHQALQDTTSRRINTATLTLSPTAHPGIRAAELHRFQHGAHEESTRIEQWAAGTVCVRAEVDPAAARGLEVLVLEGQLQDGSVQHPALSWLRWPHPPRQPLSSPTGCRLLVKTGHLNPMGHPVTHLLYLHGFRSSPRSFKAMAFKAWIERHRPDVHWACPQLPPSPAQAMAEILATVRDWPTVHSAVVGSSLGGFYAAALAERLGWRAVVLNPAVHPERDLQRHLGEQTHWHDPQLRFTFDGQHIAELRQIKPERLSDPARMAAVIAQGDELLDWREMVARFEGATIRLLPGSDHALSDFVPRDLDFVLQWLGLMPESA